MPQATYTIGSNKTGTQYRGLDNDGKQALMCHHKGSSIPAYAEAGTLWIDDTANPIWTVKWYDGTDSISMGTINSTTNVFTPTTAALYDGSRNYAADAGSNDTYAITLSPARTAYTTGELILAKLNTINTGAATINYNAIAAKSLKRPDGNDPISGDITAGSLQLNAYDGTNCILLGGLPPAHYTNAQTGTTYTVLTTDRNKLVTHSNGSAIATTLPQAGAGFESGWMYFTHNLGAGAVTITPTTSTINGAATLVLNTGDGAAIFSDGTNYTAFVGKSGTAATQADQETATSITTYVTPGRQQYHPSAAKAWVYFVGTGTVTINKSYNVSSVGDNGTGDYTINFTTAFSDASYCGVIGGYNTAAGDGGWNTFSSATTPTASLIRMICFNSSGSAQDQTRAYATFFGDQ